MPRKKTQTFVKSADTRASVASSRAELERVLRRYGATGFSVAQDYAAGTILVSFIVPDSMEKGAQKVPVKLPVRIRRIYDAMYGQPTMQQRIPDATRHPFWRAVHNPNGYDAKKLEQAERVAWRNLVLWVDAALSAAVAGMQTITEAFFAHAVVGPSGERMIEVVEQAQAALGAGVQRLLTSTVEEQG